MAFVRYKIVDGKKYYQLVRNYREAGRHRQEVLCHLGTSDSIEAAIAVTIREEARLRNKASKYLRDVEGMKEDILAIFNNKFGNDLPTRSEAVKREKVIREECNNRERSNNLGNLWEEEEFLGQVRDYRGRLESAEWYEEHAEAQLAKLEKLRRYQQQHG